MEKWFNLINKIFPINNKIFVFDKEDNTSTVYHIFGPDNHEEIDGIIIYKNLVFLINGFSGTGRSEFDQKHKFLQRFTGINSVDKLNLKPLGNNIAENEKQLKSFNEYLTQNSQYKFILKKIIFAPHITAENKIWSVLRENEFLIDKPLFKYLKYCTSEIDKDYALTEMFILMNIKFANIERLSTDTSLGEPKTDAGHSAVYSKIIGERTMYSFIAPVKDIINYIKVLRFESVPQNKKAFQRIVDKDRLIKISDNYLNRNESFPNNIILAFNPEIYTAERRSRFITNINEEKNILTLFLLEEFGSLVVIDGQHRILSHLKDKSRDINKKILISILDFKDVADPHEAMSDIFVQINNQHKKISPMVMLRINALNNPDHPHSRWYLMFKELNKGLRKNYFTDMIEFEDTPLKRFESDKKLRINISSLVKYAGISSLESGNKKYKGLLDCFNKDDLEELLRNYFGIIKELTGGSTISQTIRLTPRDIGGLIRLMVHFINDNRTKDSFINLNEIPNKNKIQQILQKIPFNKLENLDYGANAWAIMEGFFLGKIRRSYKGFGIAKGRLSKKAIKEMKKAMKKNL